jgi:hypothetical protein
VGLKFGRLWTESDWALTRLTAVTGDSQSSAENLSLQKVAPARISRSIFVQTT